MSLEKTGIDNRDNASSRRELLLGLVVIAAFLGVMGFASLGVFKKNEASERNRTISTHAAIIAALEAYREKFGEYPEALHPDEIGEFTGTSMKRGGAHMLYQAMSGDGNSAIKVIIPPKEDVAESDGRISKVERDNVIDVSPLPKAVVYPRDLAAGTVQPRLLIDGWGRPFQYTKADVDPAKTKAVNSRYDLWSLGPTSGKGAPSDSLDAKRDENVSGTWIKNW